MTEKSIQLWIHYSDGTFSKDLSHLAKVTGKIARLGEKTDHKETLSKRDWDDLELAIGDGFIVLEMVCDALHLKSDRVTTVASMRNASREAR